MLLPDSKRKKLQLRGEKWSTQSCLTSHFQRSVHVQFHLSPHSHDLCSAPGKQSHRWPHLALEMLWLNQQEASLFLCLPSPETVTLVCFFLFRLFFCMLSHLTIPVSVNRSVFIIHFIPAGRISGWKSHASRWPTGTWLRPRFLLEGQWPASDVSPWFLPIFLLLSRSPSQTLRDPFCGVRVLLFSFGLKEPSETPQLVTCFSYWASGWNLSILSPEFMHSSWA